MNPKIEELQRIIDSSKNIVFFGGAGVSTESGIPDFRSTSGLYHQEWKYPPETIISHSFFESNPTEFYRFYRAKLLLSGIKPNKAHERLAELEKAGKLLAVVTQNIDGLHQAAGSKKVYELHGSVLRNYCVNCHLFYDDTYMRNWKDDPAKPETIIPRCNHLNCRGIIKPDVVLYEEGLNDAVVNGAIAAITNADCLIIGGTTLVVYPASSLLDYFHGKKLVIINKSATSCDSRADLIINDSIGKILEQISVS